MTIELYKPERRAAPPKRRLSDQADCVAAAVGYVVIVTALVAGLFAITFHVFGVK